MIKIAICDDEAWCREMLAEHCHTYFRETGLEYRLAEYGSGEELVGAMAEAKAKGEDFADVLLLDVEMPGLSGIRLKDLLMKERREIRILFVTSHREAMPEAFGRGVCGFLEKPAEYGAFREKMELMAADIRNREKYVVVENPSGVHKIYLKQIRYIQGYGKFTQLYPKGEGSYVFSEQSLGSWKERLEGEGFFQCHKSYLVNFCHVKSIQEEILLKDGSCVPLSRRMRRDCLEAYKKYLWRMAVER